MESDPETQLTMPAKAKHMPVRIERLYPVYIVSQYTPLYWAYMYYLDTDIRGLSATDYGLLKAIYYFSVVLLEIPLGVLADRLGRRPVLILAAVQNSLGCVLYVFATDFPTFVLAEICFALSMALCSGASSALLYDSLAAESREVEYARVEGRSRAGSLIASTIGLPLTDLLLVHGGDPVGAYAATGVLSLVGVASALAMREPPRKAAGTTREIATGAYRDLGRTPGMLWLIGYGAMIFVMVRTANALLFNPVLESAGVPVSRFGTVLALVGLVASFFSWRAHALVRAGRLATLVGLPLSLMAMFALLAATSGSAAIVILCGHGIALGALPVIVSALLNEQIEKPERRATLLSLESLFSRGFYGCAALVVGHALDVVPLSWVLLGAGAIGVVPLLLVPWVMRRPPREPFRPAPPGADDRTRGQELV